MGYVAILFWYSLSMKYKLCFALYVASWATRINIVNAYLIIWPVKYNKLRGHGSRQQWIVQKMPLEENSYARAGTWYWILLRILRDNVL